MSISLMNHLSDLNEVSVTPGVNQRHTAIVNAGNLGPTSDHSGTCYE